MSRVSSDMVEVGIDSKTPISLSDFLVGGYTVGSIPITVFGKTISSSLISKALEHIYYIGGGSVVIPATDNYSDMKIVVKKNKFGNLMTRFECNSYRYPIGVETRPYTGDEWEVGDIVYNSDFENSDEKCIGWVCTESGIPGKWETYGSNSEQKQIDAILAKLNRVIVLELPVSGWSSSAPYTQTISNEQIAATDNPILSYYIEPNSSASTIVDVKKAFACIDDGNTSDGAVEFVCAEDKPGITFKVMLKGV